ncbi:MAG: tRNA lysidine(34) synthetase TilS [Syntrophus sp. (in: bacteria)]|nr:tRNA lysidine(34) synthetase TilS [Syntrophus sp. (in: bacteria)]
MELLQQIKKTIVQESLIKEGDRILLGISGGLDSTTLLFLLQKIQKTIVFDLGLAHINHSLRGKESERDEQFVIDLARKFSLQAHINKADVKEYSLQNGLSIQHAGRELRYRYFNEIATAYNYNKIAIAHNLDDQVETFLLRALKGTGLRGLSAIPIKRDIIIRPFLFTYRTQIAEYALQHSIPHVEDSSNEKTLYERNFLRKEILPAMEKLNPTYKDKLFFLLKDIVGINRFFEGQSQAFINKYLHVKQGEPFLDIDTLNQIDSETKFRVISDIITSLEPRFIPLREHFHQIQKLLSTKKPNLITSLPYGIKAKKTYNHLFFTKKPSPAPIEEVFSLSIGQNILSSLMLKLKLSYARKIPANFPKNKNIAFFDVEKLGNMTIRTFIPGDRFIPLGMNNTVKLKDFFISLKIPKEERRSIPLLLSDNIIIWVVGWRIDERFKITEKTKKVLKTMATPF